MSISICKKGLVLFLFPHRTYVLNICENHLTNFVIVSSVGIKRVVCIYINFMAGKISSPLKDFTLLDIFFIQHFAKLLNKKLNNELYYKFW